jgi:hypothetical protein
MVKIWDKNDWQLKKERKRFHLFYRGQEKISFPESFISLYEITFIPKDDYMGLRSMGQLILKVLK